MLTPDALALAFAGGQRGVERAPGAARSAPTTRCRTSTAAASPTSH